MVKPLGKVKPKKLTAKGESFAQSFIRNDGDLMKTYKDSDYSQKLTPAQMSVEANKLTKYPSIALRIKELQKAASVIAEKKFTITVEQRLKWLKDIVDAGLGDYKDAQENVRKENLSASKGAIDTMNNMLGFSDDPDNKGEPLTIQFNVSPAVGVVKVTNA